MLHERSSTHKVPTQLQPTSTTHIPNLFGKSINVFFVTIFPPSGTIPDGIHKNFKVIPRVKGLGLTILHRFGQCFSLRNVVENAKVSSYSVAKRTTYERRIRTVQSEDFT